MTRNSNHFVCEISKGGRHIQFEKIETNYFSFIYIQNKLIASPGTVAPASGY